MRSNTLEELKSIFEYLDESRHLPGFRLEPHIAPFFALFLPDILNASECIEGSVIDIIVPEFPLRKGTLGIYPTHRDQNATKKVDFVAFSEDLCTSYFIELKTDTPTRFDPEQLDYLTAAKKKKLSEFVSGILESAKNSNQKRKYVHLLNRLAYLEIVGCMQGVNSYSFKGCSGASPGWTDEIDKLARNIETQKFSNIEVVFLLPREQDTEQCRMKEFDKFILFDDVIREIKNKNEIGEQFAKCLTDWQVPAGSKKPRKS